MQLNIQGHNIELTPALRDYAEKKLNKLKEFYSNIVKVSVTLDMRDNSDSKKSQVAEVSIWLAGKKVVRATEAGESMYAAIDLVFEELKVQVTRHKEKHSDEQRRAAEKAKEISRRVAPVMSENVDVHSLVKLKRFDIKAMSKEEASAEQRALGHSFYVFRNSETGDLNVLHDEKIIDPSSLKAMSENDATAAINNTDASFIPFLNPDTNEINVVYKRKSGNLGLIEPVR